MKNTFRSLSGKHFRFYFFGQSISLIGYWVQQVALSWIAYRITGSAFMLGLVAFSGQVPMLVATPIGGVLADRFSKRNILLCTELIEMVVAITLSVIAWQQLFSPSILIIASLVLGILGAIEMPSRQAFINEIIHDRSVLSNAIALNSLTFNVARLLGPAIAGFTLAIFNESLCFVLNSFSYFASIYTLLSIRSEKVDPSKRVSSVRDGLDYIVQTPMVRWLILCVAMTSIGVSPFMTFMPVYAKVVFHGGPDLLGILLGSSGLGAFAASLYLANKKSTVNLKYVIPISCIGGGFSALFFSYNVLLSLALPLLLISGASFITVVTSCNILLQEVVPQTLRGKVMALYTMSFIGMLPIGGLIYGGIAEHLGSVKPVFIIAGVISTIFGVVLLKKFPILVNES